MRPRGRLTPESFFVSTVPATRADYYEEFGDPRAYPVLLIAPGGMRSHGDFWHRSPFDPTVELAADFRVISMADESFPIGKNSSLVTAIP